MRSNHLGIRWGTFSTGFCMGSVLPSVSGRGAGPTASVEVGESGCCDILLYTPAAPAQKIRFSGYQHKPENCGQLGDAVLKR